jgi:hypothetical protein
MFHPFQPRGRIEIKFVRGLKEQHPAMHRAVYIDLKRRTGDKPGAR